MERAQLGEGPEGRLSWTHAANMSDVKGLTGISNLLIHFTNDET